jgi:hypothetical protein
MWVCGNWAIFRQALTQECRPQTGSVKFSLSPNPVSQAESNIQSVVEGFVHDPLESG